MKWKPITEAQIWDEINASEKRMSFPQQHLWEAIRIYPEKWKQDPWGKAGNGFWVVAIIGNTVVWYNDFEHGFNRSKYVKYGEIQDYCCNQDELEWSLQFILNEITDGVPSGYVAGPPKPVA